MKQPYLLKKQRGYLTLVTVVLIVIVGFIAVALAYISFGSSFATINLQKSTSALYLAESGIEHGAHLLASYTLSERSSCASLNVTNTLGDGTYTVSGGTLLFVSSPTTLNGTLTAAATTITVASTANYASFGRIMIDREIIDYTATDATHFLNAERGQSGTSAQAHATGTAVGQYQCTLTSTGGAPKITYNSGEPGGKRVLSEVIPLPDGWVVGAVSGGILTFIRWNRPNELTWNSVGVTGNFALNGVSMASYVDGWAVGAGTTFLRWNGSTWSTVASGLSNVTYNDVFCSSKNNCHAVGNMTSNNAPIPTIADWNGTSWSNTTVNVSTRSGHQWSVTCATDTDCWSVGNAGSNATNSFFYHWNGSTWAASSLASAAFAGGDFPFRGVSCPATNYCWAVGASANFARWNGSVWARVVSGMPSAQYNSVYCNSTSDCWAVGNVSGGNFLIIRWNGTSWSRDTSNPTPAANLNFVTCTSTKDCWAVGAASGGEPAIIHWDGSSWTKFTTTTLPNVAANSISMVKTGNQPWSVWKENFS